MPSLPNVDRRASAPNACALVLLTLLAPHMAEAAQSPEAVARCAAMAEDQSRLICWDTLFPPVKTVNDAAASDDAFGLSASQRLERRGEAINLKADSALTATIARVTALRNGNTQIELDSGAIWRVTERAEPGSLRAGRAVQIRPALLGTFLLTPEGGRALRVRREL